jgi:tetracycline resistance efflux pump
MKRKSSTKAFVIAICLIIVLLIILAVVYSGRPNPTFGTGDDAETFETPFAGTFWTLLPPIVAIALALITKEVYSSLFIGCLVGAILYSNFAPWKTITSVIGTDFGILSVLSDSYNAGILAFLVMLGIIVDLMNKGGGSAAFGEWAKKSVKSRTSAQLLTICLGVLIFIDDYFNCLTVGAVMRPVTESHKISRAKLAYLIDSTAAPVCMIAPVSSWAAAISGYVATDEVAGIVLFIQQIPWNYYCLLTLLTIIVISIMNLDYGPMLTHEYNAQVKGDLFTTPERPFAGDDEYEELTKDSSVADLIIPIIFLIFICIIGLIYSGGFFDAENTDAYHHFVTAFSDADASVGLSIGSLCAMLFTFIYFWARKRISPSKSMESVPNGFIQMISPILILTLAWTLCSFTRYALGSKYFVINLMSGAGALAQFLPAVVFILAVAIGFATGTSWGTIGIMAPIIVEVFPYADNPTLCSIGLAAACAGGVCGDHCSPISDTTIMSSAGAHCYHLNHVSTQLPYAMTVAAVSFVSFILAGLIQNVVICLIISIALMLVVLFIIRSVVSKKHAGIFEEMRIADEELFGSAK